MGMTGRSRRTRDFSNQSSNSNRSGLSDQEEDEDEWLDERPVKQVLSEAASLTNALTDEVVSAVADNLASDGVVAAWQLPYLDPDDWARAQAPMGLKTGVRALMARSASVGRPAGVAVGHASPKAGGGNSSGRRPRRRRSRPKTTFAKEFEEKFLSTARPMRRIMSISGMLLTGGSSEEQRSQLITSGEMLATISGLLLPLSFEVQPIENEESVATQVWVWGEMPTVESIPVLMSVLAAALQLVGCTIGVSSAFFCAVLGSKASQEMYYMAADVLMLGWTVWLTGSWILIALVFWKVFETASPWIGVLLFALVAPTAFFFFMGVCRAVIGSVPLVWFHLPRWMHFFAYFWYPLALRWEYREAAERQAAELRHLNGLDTLDDTGSGDTAAAGNDAQARKPPSLLARNLDLDFRGSS